MVNTFVAPLDKKGKAQGQMTFSDPPLRFEGMCCANKDCGKKIERSFWGYVSLCVFPTIGIY